MSAEHQDVRPDYVPKEAYLNKEYVELERRKLWPKVWQVACRAEEIPKVGDYVTYDVADESIIVVRASADSIAAYFNACPHRGRTLTKGTGHLAHFTCKFHGWQFCLDGSSKLVLDRQDWGNLLSEDDVGLTKLRVDTWGGFVFVNPDSNAVPLTEYLGEAARILQPFEFERLRFRWYKTVVVDCNWKVALEAFNEGYHVAQTHPQVLRYMGDDHTYSKSYGIHAMFGYAPGDRPAGTPSPRMQLPMPKDFRPGLVAAMAQLEQQLKAMSTERSYRATTRLMSEVAADASAYEVISKAMQFQAEAARADGSGWPELTLQNFAEAGTDWHIFPNLVLLPTADALLAYRARPHGDDPNSCIFDIWSLMRYPPNAEPALHRELYPAGTTPDVNAVGMILSQDFANMAEVQKGMRSQGFKGSRTNPVQEVPVSNFHRALHEWLSA